MFVVGNVIEEAFSPLISAFEAVLVFIHDNIVGGSWGLAVIGLTVVIRLVLFPLFMRQMQAMAGLQRLAPQMKALQEKYKDDKQRQQQEMMKFYREHKVNPLGSCLPIVLQLPVFISLFYMLRTDLKKHICGPRLVEVYNGLSPHVRSGYHVLHAASVSQLPGSYISKISCQAVEPGSAKFLFLPDITNKATGIALVVLLVLYVGSQLASTALTSASADPNQRRLMLIFPLFFVLILYGYPAGLLVYWITTNLWTLGQGWLVRRKVGPPPPPPSFGKGRGGDGHGPVADGAGAHRGGPSAEPALAGGGPSVAAPPPSARKKKKRSGRRR